MDILHVTGKKKESYKIEFTYSILWECALGVAAITNKPLLKSLEKPNTYWLEMKQSLSNEMLDQLAYVEKNNTWKALLLTLHMENFSSLEQWEEAVQKLSSTELRFCCLPYLGSELEQSRKEAAFQKSEAINQLKEAAAEADFFPMYIEFICNVEARELREHLIKVMGGWYQMVSARDGKRVLAALQTDVEMKKRVLKKMEPVEFVKWATGGVEYMPEPSVFKVLLIPQYVYRPWNIVADLEATKVLYYPIANESLEPNDRLVPDQFLVLKHKALGDEARLKMVKMLAEEDLTLHVLTERLSIGKSTIHHHLKILRAAQLVKKVGSHYRLQKDSLANLGAELQVYLNK
ncbi:ArsR/SmtB family transcription factor [Alkalihalobacillus sp. 1P02AB]|uniref:ArsR/SmtB family transcription factor n=1 Tax=Alkalihalobacillus sp. 1P02AB TaxID=3132260 RepID=UPI0039A7312A